MTTETISQDDLASLFEDSGNQELLVAKAKAYLHRRKVKEDMEAILKEESEKFQQSESELVQAMTAAGVKSLKIEHDGKTNALTQSTSVYYSLPAGSIDNPDIMAWLQENGAKDIIKSSIHHATFSSFCKELVENASQQFSGETVLNPLHPAVKIAERRGIMLRKG